MEPEIVSTEPDVVPEPVIEAAPTEELAPAYEPNYKFNALDAEHELDEKARGYIKTKDDEDLFKDLYTKAKTFDAIKEKYGSGRKAMDFHGQAQEWQKAADELKTTNHQIGMLSTFVKNGDMDSFIASLELPKEMVMKWAIQQAKLSEAGPEERAAHENQVQQRQQLYSLQMQNQQVQNNYMQQAVQSREIELNNAIAVDTDFAGQFDTLAGRPGSFKQEVVKHAQAIWAMEKRDLSTAEAVAAVKQKFGAFLPQGAGKPTVVPPEKKVVVQDKTKTLPNLGTGSGQSPAKAKVKSIADLKKLASTMED